MESKDRLREALKQIDIVMSGADRSDLVEELEDGKETLEECREQLESSDD